MIISTMLLQHTTIINSKAYLEASLKLRLILYYENYSSFSITIVHGYVKNSKNTKEAGFKLISSRESVEA